MDVPVQYFQSVIAREIASAMRPIQRCCEGHAPFPGDTLGQQGAQASRLCRIKYIRLLNAQESQRSVTGSPCHRFTLPAALVGEAVSFILLTRFIA